MGYNKNLARIVAGLFNAQLSISNITNKAGGGRGYSVQVTDGTTRTDGPDASKSSSSKTGLCMGYGRYESAAVTGGYFPSDGVANTGGVNTGAQTTLVIGSGTTPATVDDYKLGTPITTLTPIAATTLCKDKNTGDTLSPTEFTITTTYRNDTDAAVTVNEIGIMIPVGYSSVSDSNDNTLSSCLIYREVLATPVTVEPGQIRTFTLTTDVATMLPS